MADATGTVVDWGHCTGTSESIYVEEVVIVSSPHPSKGPSSPGTTPPDFPHCCHLLSSECRQRFELSILYMLLFDPSYLGRQLVCVTAFIFLSRCQCNYYKLSILIRSCEAGTIFFFPDKVQNHTELASHNHFRKKITSQGIG